MNPTDGGKDVTVTSDDFLREQMERSQRQQTRRRRDGRSRRRHLYLTGGLAVVAVLILAAPSLVSHSSLGRSLLTQKLAEYGLQASAASVRVGWITPLRVTGLEVRGKSEASELIVDRLDTEWTVLDLLAGVAAPEGETVFRGVRLECRMREGRCSLEDDLAELLQPSGPPPQGPIRIKLQDVTLVVADQLGGGAWQVAQSNATLEFERDRFAADFAGVLSDPSGRGGSLQGNIESSVNRWQVELQSESLPLSVVTLVRRRLDQLADSIPPQVGGDATGGLRIARRSDGVLEASLRNFQVRNLTAAEGQSRLWANQLASFDGDLMLSDDRVVGQNLRASTDFASATIDAAFPRSVSIAGSQDNPLRWLESLQGTATGEVDLAALDRALPGLLPLKRDVELVSGRVTAELNSLASRGDQRRRQLVLRSEPLRARAGGRVVVIDPVRLTALVATGRDELTAEQFECRSAFANAVGSGNLRSGTANIDIDFGRLCSMLRPLVDLSTTDLDGTASGNLRWNASASEVWQLTGSGQAKNLVITMPGGKVFRRPSIESTVSAVGQWGGESLQELSEASVTFVSSGLDFSADLLRSVARPSPQTPLPLRLQGNGRLETLAETLAPWMPPQLQHVEGGFTINARGAFTSEQQSIQLAAIELKMPRVGYANRYFSQPHVKIHFDGRLTLPAGEFDAKSMTIISDAFTAAVRGVASRQHADLHVDWKANLERIQGSVRSQRVAGREPVVRQVGYQPGEQVETDNWLVMGDCEGNCDLVKDDKGLKLTAIVNGKNLAIVQPPDASLASQLAGPLRNGGNQPVDTTRRTARVIWSEPNLRIGGTLLCDPTTGLVQTDSINLAGDWFATDLAGRLAWKRDHRELDLRGPAKLKMDQVGGILSRLAGTPIKVEGIHQTPLNVQLATTPGGEIHFDVSGNLGWESGEVAGVRFGPATAPFHWTENLVRLSPTVVPVGRGRLNLAGDVYYRPGPLWMRVQPGVVAESIELTPEITTQWMKYLAPLAAEATRVSGTFGAELDEATVVFDNPQISRVVGRLNIEGVQMDAGPLTNQIINGVKQLKTLAGSPQAAPQPRTLISMPPQTVDFTVDSAVVSHKRLFFEVDRAQLFTSGRVAFDGRLDMTALIPLDPRWLGNNLQGLAGQPVALPIDGTLTRPSLDSRGLAQVVSQLGIQAAQSTAENYIQQQLNRGIDKIFGR